MPSAVLAACGVLGGCQANVFLLELILKGSPNTLYALTFAQYLVVALFSLPLVAVVDFSSRYGCIVPLCLRPSRLRTRHKLTLCLAAWLMSVAGNLVFGLYISVPVHATFRSLPLLMNMFVGYFFLGKRYTASQVVCTVTITAGLILLTVEKSRRMRVGSPDSQVKEISDEHFWWVIGVLALLCTTVFSTGLSMFQEHMYKAALQVEAASKKTDHPEKQVNSKSSLTPAPMWAEALFYSHAVGVPLFFLRADRLVSEFAAISPHSYTQFALNAFTQFVCVTSVYILNSKTSAFTLILTLTLRKLGTFVLSVIYFGHYRYFNATEWIAMCAALAASAMYPLLPKA
ncbi:putative UAA transporter family [Trypanosoma vivax]|uniref:Uncharacterized protein n=1 Tax=Trypanosoma vivax (strain Y486) TaxID=1055687 RepID=G0U411_TRYVY|nr:hypothetical protein TRVL_08739 [Trypanosoma vivax]KAH8612086.1 putative UAA transporter family [Trypanosoma vivax]CCC52173.1 conserved hypothetical protein [Trypanosoma vivax Y486]